MAGHWPSSFFVFLAKTVPNLLLLLFLLFFSCFLILVPFHSPHPSFWQEKFGENHRQTLKSGRWSVPGVLACLCTDFAPKMECFFRLALSECSRYTKCTVLWKDLSSLCQLLIRKWRHKLVPRILYLPTSRKYPGTKVRLVTCQCIQIKSAPGVGLWLNCVNTVYGGGSCFASQTLFWKLSKLFVRDPAWPGNFFFYAHFKMAATYRCRLVTSIQTPISTGIY